MLFPTFTFAVFFLVVLVLHRLLADRGGPWRIMVLVASYLFYAWWDPRFVLLIAGITAGNHLLGDRIAKAGPGTPGARRLVALAVTLDLVVLGFFKYYGFFVASLAGSLGRLGIPSPPGLEVILPVGVSFFTFQAISYVVDIGRGTLQRSSMLDFACYLAFFPHLVAGPIVRAAEFLPQLDRVAKRWRRVDLSRAMILIGGGLFKKVVISSYVSSTIVDPVFATPGRHSALETLMGIYGYAVQIYADFSGYTDIAIGLALLLGIEFPQNFDRPYSAASIQEFWRRWHMTLSRWLRDYLYISLGGNRGGTTARDRNLFLTMLLGGLWHGAAWTFVIWGALQGIGLGIERRLTERRGAPLNPWVGRVVTFHFICLGWVFFRAPTLGSAFEVLGRLATGWTSPSPAVGGVLALVIFGALAAQFVPDQTGERAGALLSRIPVGAAAAAFGVALVAIDVLGPEGVAPFIYFQF